MHFLVCAWVVSERWILASSLENHACVLSSCFRSLSDQPNWPIGSLSCEWKPPYPHPTLAQRVWRMQLWTTSSETWTFTMFRTTWAETLLSSTCIKTRLLLMTEKTRLIVHLFSSGCHQCDERESSDLFSTGSGLLPHQCFDPGDLQAGLRHADAGPSAWLGLRQRWRTVQWHQVSLTALSVCS